MIIPEEQSDMYWEWQVLGTPVISCAVGQGKGKEEIKEERRTGGIHLQPERKGRCVGRAGKKVDRIVMQRRDKTRKWRNEHD